MIWLALGFLLLGLLIGVKGMRAAGQMAGKAWRPGVGFMALASFLGAALMGMRQAWPVALALLLLGVVLSMGVRRVKANASARGAGGPPARRPGAMSDEEAQALLGIGPDATPEAIQAAYRRLMRRAHPDQGGTTGLATQLNAARDRLLGKD
jgi:hypothetical protein